MPLPVIILAGGRGERLGPLTEQTPKPLVPVQGKPYLEYQLEHLRACGITEVLVLAGYLGSQLASFLGDGSRWGLHIETIIERQPLGTGGALKALQDRLPERFLVVYGDSFLPIDLRLVGEVLESQMEPAVIVIYRDGARVTGVTPNIAYDAAGYVTVYDKSGANRRCQAIDGGVLALRREVIEALPANHPVSLEGEGFSALIAAKRLKILVSPLRFYDIGTPEGHRTFEAYVTRSEENRIHIAAKNAMYSRDFAVSYLKEIQKLLSLVNLEDVERFIDRLERVRREGRRLYLLGNGGSAATAGHFVCNLNKESRVTGKPPFRAFNLCDATEALTAYANDHGFEHIFREMIETHVEPGDAVICISVSGKSPNVLEAARRARELGASVLALVGEDGRGVGELAEVCLHVPTNPGEYGLAEDVHVMLMHLITTYFEHR